jgi:hypothetical protein
MVQKCAKVIEKTLVGVSQRRGQRRGCGMFASGGCFEVRRLSMISNEVLLAGREGNLRFARWRTDAHRADLQFKL